MLQKWMAFIGAVGVIATVACGQTDAGITTNIKSKMAADDSVKAYQINVDTRNGVVTLTGTVASRVEADRAMTLARETKGVTRVVDNLQVAK